MPLKTQQSAPRVIDSNPDLQESQSAIFIHEAMKMAFFLNEYRPFGGMPRDCLRLAQEAASRGHHVTIVTRVWQGTPLEAENVDVVLLGNRGLTNARRDHHFLQQTQAWLRTHPADLVLGFFRMPGLDAYFAADPCFEAKVRRLKPRWFRWTRRYRRFSKAEKAVFGHGFGTQVLLLHPGEIDTYAEIYGTERERLHVLPPGIKRPDPQVDHEAARQSVREELNTPPDAPLILLAGSGFRTKGLDRALVALAAQEKNTHLMVAGQDKADTFRLQAEKLGIAERVHFLGGRSDLARLMLGSDVLIHPAYSENTGTVLLEALVHGLPVIASAVCGFASHVKASGGGLVLAEPFSQEDLNRQLSALLSDSRRRKTMRRAGRAYGASQDLYSCHQRAVDLLESFGQAVEPTSKP